MLPSAITITKCGKCDNIFWARDAKEIGKAGFTNKDTPRKWQSLEYISELEIDDLVKAMQEKAQEVKDEIYLRERLWWKINDPIRHGKSESVSEKHVEVFKDNLQKLRNILGDKDESKIMKAEICRELGGFDEVPKLLLDLPEKFDIVVEKIRSLAKHKNSLVSEYSLRKPHTEFRQETKKE